MEKIEGKIKLMIGIILILILILVMLIIWNKTSEDKNNANGTSTGGEAGTTAGTEIASTDDFSLEFLKMENSDGENMIYSPLSIKYALKMLQEGASGNTLAQIENIIGSLSVPTYENIDEILSIANGVFIRDTYYKYVKQDYIDILQTKYSAEIRQDSFASAQNVNQWIEEKTLNLISNMLSDEVVQNPDLEMLLINALAIDMEWENKFDCSDTYGSNFYLSDGSTMTATTMTQTTSDDGVSYYKGSDVTVLTMDLEEENGVQLEFMAIMPEEDLSDYVANLTADQIDEITENLRLASDTSKGVKIKIPKFIFEYDLGLKQDLINLGITDAFDENLADLSNIADLESTGAKLYVSDALHKANIEFTEKGVKAAAVTVFMNEDSSMVLDEGKPIDVIIDNPFVFIIRDKDTKEIWFTGTVYEPNAWEDDKEEYTGTSMIEGFYVN